MKIYTRTGDDGTTGLFGGGRVGKDSPRVAAYGAVDELNAAVGVARATGANRGGSTEARGGRPGSADADLDADLQRVQNDLFDLGADLATPHGAKAESKVRRIQTGDAAWLEAAIDRLEAELPPLQEFILPGGSPMGAALHQARAVCRRAERDIVALAESEDVGAGVVTYINRLSDFLFVAARAANTRAGHDEPRWSKGR